MPGRNNPREGFVLASCIRDFSPPWWEEKEMEQSGHWKDLLQGTTPKDMPQWSTSYSLPQPPDLHSPSACKAIVLLNSIKKLIHGLGPNIHSRKFHHRHTQSCALWGIPKSNWLHNDIARKGTSKSAIRFVFCWPSTAGHEVYPEE